MRSRVSAVVVAGGVLSAGLVGGFAGPAAALTPCPSPNLVRLGSTGQSVSPSCVLPPTNLSPTVSLNSVARQPGGVVVSGTATDPDGIAPVQVVIKIAGVAMGTLTAGTNGGFYGTVPAREGTSVCATALNQDDGSDQTVCKSFTVQVNPFGYLDEVSAGPAGLHVRGWAIDPDTASPIAVHVYMDGVFVTGTTASADRPDVGAAYPGYGSAHGFDLTVPAAQGPHTVCTYGINVNAGTVNTQLGCMTVTQGGPPATPSVDINPSETTPQVDVDVTPGSPDTTRYVIERSTGTQPAPWSVVKTIDGQSVNGYLWFDTSVVQGTNYCYRATAYNAYGASAPSTAACDFLPFPPLPKPTNVSATDVTQTSLTLNWTDNAIGENLYLINRTGANTITITGTPGTGPMSQAISGLQAGTQYCFEIAPMKTQPGQATGYDPAKFCATTASAPPPPPPPGVKTVQVWNCDAYFRGGSIWLWNYTTGGWTRATSAPSSWTGFGCGPSYSGPAASVDLPGNQYVDVVEVIVDGSYCTADDPSNSNCRRWESGPLRGDTNGTVKYATIG